MPERPILILPRPGAPLPREKRRMGFREHYRLPTRDELSRKFTSRVESLIESFVTTKPEAISPENILVLETVGRIDDFRSAVSRIPGLNWQGEIDIDDIQSDDSYFERPKIGTDFFKDRVFGFERSDSKIVKDAFTKAAIIDDDGYLNENIEPHHIIDAIPEEYEQHQRDILRALESEKDKNLSGRLYLSLSNRQALAEIKTLFDSWKNNEEPPQLTAPWKNLFSRLHDVRFWDVEDRLRDTGIIDYWEKEVELKKGTSSTIVFEAELSFSDDDIDRTSRQERIEQLINKENGRLINTCQIQEIRFHAIKIELPISGVEKVLKGEYSPLFKNGGILFFRPVPQNCLQEFPKGELSDIVEIEPPKKDPIVALLDGVPFSRHGLLKDFLIIDDPDNLSEEYNYNEYCHGTAMASLICHGEIDSGSPSLNSKVYVRPVLAPSDSRSRVETVPKHVFFEDVIERSVRRMIEGEGEEPPAAPSVKVVNLSIADPVRAFHHYPSPIARLLDWLSYKYDVLFCISSGNYLSDITLGIDDQSFLSLTPDEKTILTVKSINDDKRNRRIYAPSESINSLSVGALHSDNSPESPLGKRIDLQPNKNLFSPVSTVGHGFRSSIKPEIYFPGGRQLYNYIEDGVFSIAVSSQPPGQKVAGVPVNVGEVNRTLYTRGTSNAAALASRSAVFIYDMLEQLFLDSDEELPANGIAPLLKTLLVHSASWGESINLLSSILSFNSHQQKKETARYLGYGIPDIDRVLGCTENRATAIGFGVLGKDHRHEYHFPLPPSLSGTDFWRRLTITLGWNTPINADNRKYRRAALTFEPTKLAEKIGGNRMEADWQQVRNGTVQHEIIEGKRVKAYIEGDSLVVAVQCREDAGPLDIDVHYALAVSLEVKVGTEIPIYDEVRNAIEITIRDRIIDQVRS